HTVDSYIDARCESWVVDNGTVSDVRERFKGNLIATIRAKLPDLAGMCADDSELVMLHQDSFAADYQDDEYALLGMATKYAGLRGKEVRVIGKNRSTLSEEARIQ